MRQSLTFIVPILIIGSQHWLALPLAASTFLPADIHHRWPHTKGSKTKRNEFTSSKDHLHAGPVGSGSKRSVLFTLAWESKLLDKRSLFVLRPVCPQFIWERCASVQIWCPQVLSSFRPRQPMLRVLLAFCDPTKWKRQNWCYIALKPRTNRIKNRDDSLFFDCKSRSLATFPGCCASQDTSKDGENNRGIYALKLGRHVVLSTTVTLHALETKLSWWYQQVLRWTPADSRTVGSVGWDDWRDPQPDRKLWPPQKPEKVCVWF